MCRPVCDKLYKENFIKKYTTKEEDVIINQHSFCYPTIYICHTRII